MGRRSCGISQCRVTGIPSMATPSCADSFSIPDECNSRGRRRAQTGFKGPFHSVAQQSRSAAVPDRGKSRWGWVWFYGTRAENRQALAIDRPTRKPDSDRFYFFRCDLRALRGQRDSTGQTRGDGQDKNRRRESRGREKMGAVCAWGMLWA